MYENSTVGITGASSFLGVNLLHVLKRTNYKLRIFDGNLLKLSDVDEFVKGCDTVIHLTGRRQSSFEYTVWDEVILGAYHVARSCIKHDAEVISCGIATQYYHGVAHEIADTVFMKMQNIGLRSVVLCFPNLFGPHCQPYHDSHISTLIYLKATNKPYKANLLFNYTVPEQLLHVADACMCIENYLRIGIKAHQGTKVPSKFAGQFSIAWRDFAAVMEGQKPLGVVPPRAEYFIRETLQWYKDNART